MTARSIVVLSGDHADPDAAAIKTALALTHTLPEGADVPIVAALQDPDNLMRPAWWAGTRPAGCRRPP